jgi:hypothetical protein
MLFRVAVFVRSVTLFVAVGLSFAAFAANSDEDFGACQRALAVASSNQNQTLKARLAQAVNSLSPYLRLNRPRLNETLTTRLVQIANLTKNELQQAINVSGRKDVYRAATTRKRQTPVLSNETFELGLTVVGKGDGLQIRVQLYDSAYAGKNTFRDYPLKDSGLAAFILGQAEPSRDDLGAVNQLCKRARQDFVPVRISAVKKLIKNSADAMGVESIEELPAAGKEGVPSLRIDYGTETNTRSTVAMGFTDSSLVLIAIRVRNDGTIVWSKAIYNYEHLSMLLNGYFFGDRVTAQVMGGTNFVQSGPSLFTPTEIWKNGRPARTYDKLPDWIGASE